VVNVHDSTMVERSCACGASKVKVARARNVVRDNNNGGEELHVRSLKGEGHMRGGDEIGLCNYGEGRKEPRFWT